MRPYELTAAERRVRTGRTVASRPRAAVEIPTLLLILATYAAWLVMTFEYGRWPPWVAVPVTAVLLTLHGSLQHEMVHGHPTRWRHINRLLALVPLSLWLPYRRYEQSHLAHHVDERLTDPIDDPESYYWTASDWARLSRVSRALVRTQQTLAGRITLGPFWTIYRFVLAEWRLVRRKARGVRGVWIEHLLWCVPVILWVSIVCRIPLWVYLGTMAIPGLSLTLVRSFAEHRARPPVRYRVAIVEGSWILGPLYLFNNLHALHHEAPWIPWYEYPARYRLHRERLIRENGALLYRTYFDVARRFLFRAHDAPVHPTNRVPIEPTETRNAA